MADADSARETQAEARRILRICQACLYCEGYCATFPALSQLRDLSEADIDYLANLCHGCRDCYFACQYASPHVFDVNVPRVLGEVRQHSYVTYSRPRALGAAVRAGGRTVAAVTVTVTALALVAAFALVPGEALLAAHRGAGAFYRVVPWEIMAPAAGLTLLMGLAALTLATRAFWRAIRPPVATFAVWRAMPRAAADSVTLRNLAGGGTGCQEADAAGSQQRRILHQIMVAGLLLCLAATITAAAYAHLLKWPAPYPLASLPVLSGAAGGVLLSAGALGLLVIKRRADPAPLAVETAGGEVAALALLAAVGLSGLAVLAIRDTAAMGLTLTVHLALVISLFALLPCSKLVHAPFRAAALVRAAIERRATLGVSTTPPRREGGASRPKVARLFDE